MAPSFADIPWLPKDTWLSFWTGCSFNFVLRFSFTCFCTRGILFTFSRGCFCVPMHGRQAKLIKKVSSVCLSRWLRWVSRNVEFLGEVAKHRLVCNCRRDYCVAVMCLLRKYRTYIRRRSWMPAWCVELSYHARIPNRGAMPSFCRALAKARLKLFAAGTSFRCLPLPRMVRFQAMSKRVLRACLSVRVRVPEKHIFNAVVAALRFVMTLRTILNCNE